MGKFLPFADIVQAAGQACRQGKIIVTTNGCFDLLHPGHVACLTEARAQGDLLMVGVNSDESVRKLKGPGRPLLGENDRVRMVAALQAVDFAFLFSDPDPRNFLEKIRPQVHVKGGAYQPPLLEQETVERYGGRIYRSVMVPGFSTTALLKKIQALDRTDL
jgi:rfaE bifunctional protein nucleotidyltransferase chain/domain